MARITAAMHQELFENAPDGFFFMLLDLPAPEPLGSAALLDRIWNDARLALANAALARQHGVPRARLIGRTTSEMLGLPSDAGRAQLERALSTRGSHAVQAMRTLGGRELWIDAHYRVLHDVEGRVVGFLGIQRDITHVRRLQDELEERAATDPLTGAGNRRLLEERFHQHVAEGARRITLLYIDLDGFKRINDRAGHGAGDTALARYAERLRAMLRAGDALVRIGGDEFVVLAPHATEHDDAALVERVTEPADLGVPEHDPVTLSCSVGVAHFPADGVELGELIEVADRRMYHHKAERGARGARGAGGGSGPRLVPG